MTPSSDPWVSRHFRRLWHYWTDWCNCYVFNFVLKSFHGNSLCPPRPPHQQPRIPTNILILLSHLSKRTSDVLNLFLSTHNMTCIYSESKVFFIQCKKNLILPTAGKQHCWIGGTDYGARSLLVFRSCLSFLTCSRGIVRYSGCENVMGLSHIKQCAQHHSWQTVIMNHIDSHYLGPGSHLSYL